MKTLVTNNELELVGECLIYKYITEYQKRYPKSVDIEGFITEFLHLPIVYTTIADGDLDKVGFTSDGSYPLKVHENGTVVEKVYPKGTVVIDNYLLRTDKSGRRRFTLAHEAAHVIFERMSPSAPGPCFNRGFDKDQNYTATELHERLNFCEVQTDRLASVLLMPRFLVEEVMKKYRNGAPIPLYANSVMRKQDKLSVQKMADILGVSYTAFMTRLKHLHLVEHRNMEEYLALEMNFGGNA